MSPQEAFRLVGKLDVNHHREIDAIVAVYNERFRNPILRHQVEAVIQIARELHPGLTGGAMPGCPAAVLP